MNSINSLDNAKLSYLLYGDASEQSPPKVVESLAMTGRDAIVSTDGYGHCEVVELPTVEEFLIGVFNLGQRLSNGNVSRNKALNGNLAISH